MRSSLGTDVVPIRIEAPMYAAEADSASQISVLPLIRHVGVIDDRTPAEWHSATDVLVPTPAVYDDVLE